MNQQGKIIDTKLPLTWLLSTAGTIIGFLILTIWNVSAQTNKIDQLIITNAKLEKRLDERDIAADRSRESIYALQRVADALELRVGVIERAQRK